MNHISKNQKSHRQNPARPLWEEPLGGTHNSAAVQGNDKTLEFPNTNCYAVTVLHSCDVSRNQKLYSKIYTTQKIGLCNGYYY